MSDTPKTILLVVLVVIAAGLGLYRLNAKTPAQRFRTFGIELPADAESISIQSKGLGFEISFFLPDAKVKEFVAIPIPGYAGWRRQRSGEMVSLLTEDITKNENISINEMITQGGNEIRRIVVNEDTKKVSAMYVRSY